MSVTTLTDRGILDTAYLPGSVEEEERVRYRDGIEGGAYTLPASLLTLVGGSDSEEGRGRQSGRPEHGI